MNKSRIPEIVDMKRELEVLEIIKAIVPETSPTYYALMGATVALVWAMEPGSVKPSKKLVEELKDGAEVRPGRGNGSRRWDLPMLKFRMPTEDEQVVDYIRDFVRNVNDWVAEVNAGESYGSVKPNTPSMPVPGGERVKQLERMSTTPTKVVGP